MRLAGQGDRVLQSERGYAMAALLVGLSVMAVMMSAALPVWSHMMKREREEELIWRGEQYKRAIRLFQAKYANTFPPTLDVLVEQKFLRKKYKDPITDDEFQIIPVGAPVRPGAPGMPGFGQPGTDPQQQGRSPGQQSAGQQAQGQQQFTQAVQQSQQRLGQQQAALGIQGVTSKSKDTSIKLYNGRDKYNEWAFIHVAVAQRPGGIGAQQPGQQVRPGSMPGQNGPMGPAGFNNPNPLAPGGFGGRGGGMQPGGFGNPQPGGFGTPQQPGGFGAPQPNNGRSPFGTQPGGAQPNPGPFQTPGPFQPVTPQPTRPGVPPPGGLGGRPPGM